MGLWKRLATKIFHKDYNAQSDAFWENLECEEFLDEFNEDSNEEAEWDWESLTKKRSLFKASDPLSREKYIRSLVEQVKDASAELDKLSYEYNVVTALLRDMDEIDALPYEQKKEMEECIDKILYYEREQREFREKKTRMTNEQYQRMDEFADNMPKAYEDIKSAEEYKELVKEDLKRLEGERHAYQYRKDELNHDMGNARGMSLICAVAALLCFFMLVIMQFGFEMDTKFGYILTIMGGAVALTVLYVKYQDASQELKKTESGINRIILLQNTVKIRYVNNTHLLEYLYMKYNTKSAKELKRLWDLYADEKRERERDEENGKELVFYKEELLKCLRCFPLSDIRMWVNHPLALIDRKEMVEIRHEYILRRQKLRSQMDYNRRLAKDGEKELKEFAAAYPQYARETLIMMDKYEG